MEVVLHNPHTKATLTAAYVPLGPASAVSPQSLSAQMQYIETFCQTYFKMAYEASDAKQPSTTIKVTFI